MHFIPEKAKDIKLGGINFLVVTPWEYRSI